VLLVCLIAIVTVHMLLEIIYRLKCDCWNSGIWDNSAPIAQTVNF